MYRKFFIVLICFSLLLTGCSIDYKNLFKKEDSPVSNLEADSVLLSNDLIYNQTVELINSAQKSIFVEQGLFTDQRLSQLLIAKSKSGIDVHVLMDQFHSENKATLTDFKNNQVSAQFYPARKGQANRFKLLVVDSSQAIVYSNYWDLESWNQDNMAIMLNGNSAWRLANDVYKRDWTFTTTLTLEVPEKTSQVDDNITPAANANVKQQITQQISASKQSIWLELTELEERDTLQALIDAAARGLDVRVILDEKAKSTPVIIENLKAAGIQVRLYKEKNSQPLGLNLGIYDGKTFIFSSSGWTYYTFVINHEMSITVPSPLATAKLIEKFDVDWQSGSTI